MINFDEEIKNYEPSLEIEEAESAIYSHDLTDVTDIIELNLVEFLLSETCFVFHLLHYTIPL